MALQGKVKSRRDGRHHFFPYEQQTIRIFSLTETYPNISLHCICKFLFRFREFISPKTGVASPKQQSE